MTKHIVIVEDSVFFREVWTTFTKRAHLAFECPSAFLDALAKNTDVLDNAELLVLDNHFDQEPERTGTKLAEKVRALGYSGRIILSSLGDLDLPGTIDGRAGKNPEEIWQVFLNL